MTMISEKREPAYDDDYAMDDAFPRDCWPISEEIKQVINYSYLYLQMI